jgi:hypothetical protein
VPTWCLFRAQFYFNGHNWLASKLKAARVSFQTSSLSVAITGESLRPSTRPTSSSAAGGDFSIRIHGTRVRHYLGPASINMYDKHGFILRVETTTNDVSFFRHHRMVEQRDRQRVMRLAD